MKFPKFKELHSFTGVYSITCLESEFRYIGATTRASFAKRYTYHKNEMIKGNIKSLMVDDFNKYGIESFVFGVLFISNDPVEIANKEKEFISYYKNIGKSYNLKSGGDFCQISKSTLNQISAASKENSKNRTLSLESRNKISRTLSSDHCSLAILNEEKVAEIKQKLISGCSMKSLSEEYSVSVVTIKNIAYERRWKYVCVDGWEKYFSTLPRAHVISEEQELEIVSLLKQGKNKNYIHKKYGVSYDKINRIIKKYNI